MKGGQRLRRRAMWVARALEARYATPDLGNKADAVDEVVFIALTRQTHEANAGRSWAAVAAAGGPEALVRMKERTLVRLLAPGGLARQKAQWIRGALLRIKETFGELSLRGTAGWADQRVESFLCTLPGVSIKSAKCVMMYSLGRKVLPVDVHVRRVAERLGLVSPGLSEREIHSVLEALIPSGMRRAFHVNTVCHGRTLCKPARPQCDVCPLARHCAFHRQT